MDGYSFYQDVALGVKVSWRLHVAAIAIDVVSALSFLFEPSFIHVSFRQRRPLIAQD